jgi:hypothetical protein
MINSSSVGSLQVCLSVLILAMQASGADSQSFVRTRIGILHEDTQKGLPSEFSIEDIKGAAATIVIAGNDTVSQTTTRSSTSLRCLFLLRQPLPSCCSSSIS